MANDEGQRKLVAILAADVVGYSRLMADDERATVRTLTEHREVFSERVAAHQGRIVDTAGDSVLATFDSVVTAVEAAVEVQRELAARNEALPGHRKMHCRIGVNLGDIIIRDDGTIYGDGVNVAARLESLAEPSGVMLSEDAYRQVRTKTALRFADAGEHKVKNIADPVRVYRWTDATADTIPGIAGAEGALRLPDKPSIAVLPFVNMSGDDDQEYFADGLTEDIITELSRYQTFFVIARNSSFAYKGQAVNVGKVGQELGVAYVVEGSVRKAGNRVRITAQLVETASGKHIWAERYDHDMTDMFDVQDEVTRSIVAAIPGRLESADLDRIKRKRPEDMAVYDYVLRGKMHHHRATKDDNAEALRLLDKAIDLDPEFAESYAWKACTLGQALARGFGDNKEELFAQDVAAVEKALSLSENNFECHWIMCEVRMMADRLDEAEFHHYKAFALNPNDPRVVAQRSELLTWLGRPDEGVEWAHQAMRLDPYNAAGRAHLLGRALYMAGSYEDAIAAYKQVRALSFGHHAEIAACYAQLGLDEKASPHVEKALSLKPDFSINDHAQGLPFKRRQDRERYCHGLRKAGLPD